MDRFGLKKARKKARKKTFGSPVKSVMSSPAMKTFDKNRKGGKFRPQKSWKSNKPEGKSFRRDDDRQQDSKPDFKGKKPWKKSFDDRNKDNNRDRSNKDRDYDKPRRSFDNRDKPERFNRERDDKKPSKFKDKGPRRDFGDRDKPARFSRDRDDKKSYKFNDKGPRKEFKSRKEFGKEFGPRKKFESRERPPREDNHKEGHHIGPRPNLYGIHAVREAWLNPERKIEALYLAPGGQEAFKEIFNQTPRDLKRPVPAIIDKDKMDRMLPRGAVHQGIAILAKPLDEVFLKDLIIKSETQEKTVLIILDQVTDPHNVGAILRSASAFGAGGVIMQRKHAPELEFVLAKTASGAVEHLPVCYETNLSRTIEELKENGFFVFGLDERGERTIGQVTAHNAKGAEKIVLVLGAEGDGLRRLVKEHCDELVKLPTQGAIASLNVSNAAAVALYALFSSPSGRG
jgi:23S rRNA (guanosine2251-2'-O)-methyltransferase